MLVAKLKCIKSILFGRFLNIGWKNKERKVKNSRNHRYITEAKPRVINLWFEAFFTFSRVQYSTFRHNLDRKMHFQKVTSLRKCYFRLGLGHGEKTIRRLSWDLDGSWCWRGKNGKTCFWGKEKIVTWWVNSDFGFVRHKNLRSYRLDLWKWSCIFFLCLFN